MATSIIERLTKSDFVQSIFRKHEEEDDARRVARALKLVEERAGILERTNRATPGLKAARAKAEREDDVAQAAAEATKRKRLEAIDAEHSLIVVADHAVAQIEGQLRASAPPEIDEFQNEMRQLYDHARARPIGEEAWRGPLNLYTDKKPVHFRSTMRSQERHLKTILRVIREAEGLKLTAEPVKELRARLDAMRDEVRAHERYEYTVPGGPEAA